MRNLTYVAKGNARIARLADDLKKSQVELGESCAKSETLSALNTDLQNQLEDARKKCQTLVTRVIR